MFREGRACAPNSERAPFIAPSSNSNWISFETKTACFKSSSLLLISFSALTKSSPWEGGTSWVDRRASKRVLSRLVAT